MSTMNFRLMPLVTALALAACGSAGTSTDTSGNPNPVTPPVVTPQYGTLKLTWQIGTAGSSSARRTQFVSPNASKIEVKVNTVNGSPPPTWVPADTVTALTVSGGTPNCVVTGGVEACTVPVAAPPGSVSYTINIEDVSNNILATITTLQTIAQGTNNNISLTLMGIVNSVSVSAATLTANDSSHATTGESVTVNAYDASGAKIVNGTGSTANYDNPFTLTDNDPTGQTALKLNGGSASSSVTVSGPADNVTLTYTGQATNNFTISPGGTGISCTGGCNIATSVNDVGLTGTLLDTAPNGGLNADSNWGQQTVFFSTNSGSQSISAAEVGWSNAPFSKQFSVALTGCAGIASVTSGPATTFTVSALGIGVCSGRITEFGTGYPITQHAANSSGSATHDGTFWVSVTTATIGVNSKHRRH